MARTKSKVNAKAGMVPLNSLPMLFKNNVRVEGSQIIIKYEYRPPKKDHFDMYVLEIGKSTTKRVGWRDCSCVRVRLFDRLF
jgi:hypothetical protein